MQDKVSKTVKVKFNATHIFRNISDDDLAKLQAEMEKLKDDDYEKFGRRIMSGSKGELITASAGDVVDLPNWYYQAHKKCMVKTSVSLDVPKYARKSGERIPFKMSEAIGVNLLKEDSLTMKEMPLFERV